MCNTASCPVCGGCEAEDALLSIMQFADQAPDPTADPYGAEAAFGRIVEMARAASQERPQPDEWCRGNCLTQHVHRYGPTASQERPSIDVERLARAMANHINEAAGDDHLCTSQCAADILSRLSGPVGE